MSTVRELDAIVRAGKCLDNAVSELSNEGLGALVNRFDGAPMSNRRQADIFVRRHLIGLHKFKPTGVRNDD